MNFFSFHTDRFSSLNKWMNLCICSPSRQFCLLYPAKEQHCSFSDIIDYVLWIIKNKQTKTAKMEQIQQFQTITSDFGKVNSILCHVWWFCDGLYTSHSDPFPDASRCSRNHEQHNISHSFSAARSLAERDSKYNVWLNRKKDLRKGIHQIRNSLIHNQITFPKMRLLKVQSNPDYFSYESAATVKLNCSKM